MTATWGEIQGKLDSVRVLRVRVIRVLLYTDREGLEDVVHTRDKKRKVLLFALLMNRPAHEPLRCG